jgi:hypothetical protein
MAVRSRWLRSRVFGIPPRDWYFVHLGFPEADPAKRRHLERIRYSLVDGYHATHEDSRRQALALWLNAIDRQSGRPVCGKGSPYGERCLPWPAVRREGARL